MGRTASFGQTRRVDHDLTLRPSASGPAGRPPVPWRTVGLPVEHGGWSFLLEPVVLGLALVPSVPGLCLGVAALAAFLVRHPLRLVALDWRKGVRYPRTDLAMRFVVAYALAAAVFAAAALVLAGPRFGLAILAAGPLGLFALGLDLSGRGRDVLAELAGAVALGASVTAIVLAGGGPLSVAWMAWLLQAVRAVTAILYVRARLAHEREGGASAMPVVATHGAAVALVGSLVAADLAPRLAVVAFVLLLARAAWGLHGAPRHVRAQRVGVQEVIFGAITVVLLAVGFRAAI
jgi:hypothetical protein